MKQRMYERSVWLLFLAITIVFVAKISGMDFLPENFCYLTPQQEECLEKLAAHDALSNEVIKKAGTILSVPPIQARKELFSLRESLNKALLSVVMAWKPEQDNEICDLAQLLVKAGADLHYSIVTIECLSVGKNGNYKKIEMQTCASIQSEAKGRFKAYLDSLERSAVVFHS